MNSCPEALPTFQIPFQIPDCLITLQPSHIETLEFLEGWNLQMNEKQETQNPEVLQQLFEISDPKAFAKLFKAGQEEWGEPREFIRRVAAEIPATLYEKYYGDLVPHSFFGLSCAAATLSLFPEERLWWPCVQQAWLIANSRKRRPWSGVSEEAVTDQPPADRWNQFEEAASNHQFETCYALVRGFLGNSQERDFFRTHSLSLAINDTAHGGLKFIQLAQAWEMAESLDWDHSELILFPAFHFLVLGPRQDRLAGLAVQAEPFEISEEGDGAVVEEELEILEEAVLYSDDPSTALAALSRLASRGNTFESIHEALLLTAVQALNNAQIGRWLLPIRALLYTDALQDWTRRAGTGNRGHGLTVASLLIQEASRKSREARQARPVVDKVESVCPTDPFETLRSLVSHSDPFASANTVQAILGMGDEGRPQLVQALATLAAKNDASVGQGYDLLLVKTCAAAHQRSQSQLKDRFLVGCAFFLGRILKNYELFGAYGVK